MGMLWTCLPFFLFFVSADSQSLEVKLFIFFSLTSVVHVLYWELLHYSVNSNLGHNNNFIITNPNSKKAEIIKIGFVFCNHLNQFCVNLPFAGTVIKKERGF